MTDFASRRVMMVDTQVRPSDVTKFPIIAAMLAVPREAHVPEPLREAAYMGKNLDLAPGRVLMEPRTLAKMLEALDIGPEDRVLTLGAGTGYGVAVMAAMAGSVLGIEADAGLAAMAGAALAAQGLRNGQVRQGRPEMGATESFDAIVIEGGVEQIPEAVLAALTEGGRIVAIFMSGALGQVKLGRKAGGKVSWAFVFNAEAPVLDGFSAVRGFSL